MIISKNIFYVFASTILLMSCHKKQLPNENDQEPVFYLKGELEGKPILLEAGKSDYFMNAQYDWDTTNVCVFKSSLQQQSCAGTCNGYTLTVLMNDSKMSLAGSSVKLNDVLKVGPYVFNDKDLPSVYYKVNLIPKSSKIASETYNWTIENGIDYSQIFNKYCPSAILNAQKQYSFTLSYDNNSGCNSSHQNVFYVGSPLQTTINAVRSPVSTSAIYDFSSQSSGMAPYQYLWDFGDGTSSNLVNPNHSFQVILNGRSTVKLRVIDANKDTCISYYQVQTSGDPTCDANFTASFTPIPNTKAFNTITILITYPNGVVYSSKNMAQPANSIFDVLEVNNYIENNDHRPTQKIKARINCMLSDGTNQIKLSNAEVSLAFAYSY